MRGRIRARPEGTLAKRSGARTCDREHVKDPGFATKKSPSECLSFNSCGGRIRTCDLQVMSLASYQLLHSAMLFSLDFPGLFSKSAAKVRIISGIHKYLCCFFEKTLFLQLFTAFFLLNSKKNPTFAHCNCYVQSINPGRS